MLRQRLIFHVIKYKFFIHVVKSIKQEPEKMFSDDLMSLIMESVKPGEQLNDLQVPPL